MGEDLFENFNNNDWIASEEIIKIDRALEESKKIQSSLEASILQIEKLKSKYDLASNNYFYNFTPSKRPSRCCSKAEYLIFSIYDVHLTKLCQQIDSLSPAAQSPQQHQNFISPLNRNHSRVRKINYTSSSCSSSPSSSSTELINQMEIDETTVDGQQNRKFTEITERKLGVRSHKDILASYNRTKTERIKCKREIEAAMTSLDKALTLSTNRAVEAKNYGWIRPKMQTPLKRFSMMPARRSISTSICRLRRSTPVKIKRPLSTSLIF